MSTPPTRLPLARLALARLALSVGLSMALLLPACRNHSGGDGPPARITEDFANPADRDPAATTAAWTLEGQPGLHATFGYGGDGQDGVLDLAGRLTLTSGDDPNRTPAADGAVEWNFARLHVRAGATLTLCGAYPIRLNVLGDGVIDGTIEASGRDGSNAPAGRASEVGKIPGGVGGPGGGPGGDANVNPLDPIGSLPMDLRGGAGYPMVTNRCGDPNRSDNRLITVIESNCGGGVGGNRGVPSGTLLRSGCSGNGGGHGTDGGQTDTLCANVGAFGRSAGIAWILPTGAHQVESPTAGAGGGAGGNAATTAGSNPLPSADIVAGSGGGGAGGLEIVCAGVLRLGAGGRVLANGGSGGAGHTTVASGSTLRAGYGGGGAGGSLWLSATSVVVEAGGALSAIGGTGNPNPPDPFRTGNGGAGYVIVRDLGGNPEVNGASAPLPVAGRETFAPTPNGTSSAVSRWYDSGRSDPRWAFAASDPQTGAVVPGHDLVFVNAPAAGQRVTIAFQGAPAVNDQPDPDPTHWLPAGNTAQDPYATFETDVAKLRGVGMRFIRFRIDFDIGTRRKGEPAPNRVVIERVAIAY